MTRVLVEAVVSDGTIVVPVTAVPVGPQGPQGPTGPTGPAGPVLANLKGSVIHDDDPDVARPTGYLSIEWRGSVEPNNADLDADTWIDTS